MKIALLGAKESGKTVYFSAIYHRFRNVVAWPILTDKKKQEFLRNGVEKQVGFRLRLDDIDLEATLSANGNNLMQRPIVDWPDANVALNKSNIQVRFDFLPISESTNGNARPPVRSYSRAIEVYDPPGGVFRGGHHESDDILKELMTCDIGVVFLPADRLLEIVSTDAHSEVDPDEWAEVANKITLGKILEVTEAIRHRLSDNDVFPLCFVISKSDLFYRHRDSVELMEQLVYKNLLIPFSREHPEFVICSCPVSVVDPVTGNFKSSNLEWPFLFAAGGTLMRNYSLLAAQAETKEREARRAESKAAELLALRHRSLWMRFVRWWKDGETIGEHQRAAASLRDSAGRKIARAHDDRDLAYDIWSSITAEGRERGFRVLMNGEYAEDVSVAFENT